MNGLFILGIILFIVAFIFIGIEMIIPGFGAPGIIGCCCLAAGVSLTANTYTQAIMIIAIILILLTVFVVIMTFLLYKGVLKSPIVLKDKQEKETGYISSTDLEYLIGKQGITTTALRPAGRVKIEGVEFDVISDGRFIEKDKKVVIYKISNSSLVVKEI